MKSSTHRFGTRALLALACSVVLSLVAALLVAVPALAGTVTNDRPFLFSFDGSDTTASAFTSPGGIAIDNSGDVYVVNTAGQDKGPGPYDSQRVIDKFLPDGTATDFTGVGKSSLDGSGITGVGAFGIQGRFDAGIVADVAVDNSAVNPGRVYVSEGYGPVHAFNPDGSYLWTLNSGFESQGIAVDTAGHLWVIDTSGFPNSKALEFAATGSPPAQIGSFPLAPGYATTYFPAIDQSGNLYLASGGDGQFAEKYVGGIFDSSLTPKYTTDIAVDQSSPTGNVFALHIPGYNADTGFQEFNSSGAEVAGSQFGDEVLGAGRSIAYNPAKDWVYVSDDASNTVKVFGPIASGSVPDVTMSPTDPIGLSTATANATINPQNLNNSYHFEWAVGGDEVQHLHVSGTGGTFKIGTPYSNPVYTGPLPFDISPAALQSALENLGEIGAGNVSVTGTPADGGIHGHGEYDITFVGALTGKNVDQLVADNTNLVGFSQPGARFDTTANGPNWGAAQSSPDQSATVDTNPHDVSQLLTGLDPNTAYSVRLVGTNTDNHLSAYALPDVFKTNAAPLPTVSIDSISPITTSTAHVAATIDPHEDTTNWKVQKSTDPSCSGDFVDEPTQTISHPGPGDISSVTWDLTGLLPAQTYCVRVSATNHTGTTTADEVIQTLPVAPTDVQTAFAAPRTDTTARINGRVDPQGQAAITGGITYQFETSTDDINWTPRPVLTSNVDGREPVVVADQLTGLQPDTTYYYRFAMVKNNASPTPQNAASLGGEKKFTTRSTAEVSDPNPCSNEDVRAAQHTTYLGACRGIELVNNPDKGNQNIISQPPPVGDSAITADGDKALWQVVGGAPGGPNGTQSVFIARRAADGWHSQSAAPPAAQQFGGGTLTYEADAVTPDLNSFVFAANTPSALASPSAPTMVRVSGGTQDALKTYLGQPPNPVWQTSLDLSNDGKHVFVIDMQTQQLEDIGDARVGPPAVPGEVVSLMPDGSPSACGLDVFTGASFGISVYPGYHWIGTDDGSRVYFRAKPNANCAAPWGLYVRNREAGKTTLIDPGDPQYLRATPDGRQAYFLTQSALDPADTDSAYDLYRWDEQAGASTCLTCVAATAGDVGDVAVSDDFSHAYFASRDQLVPGQGKPGAFNLYALSGGQVSFVATTGFGASAAAGSANPELSHDGNVLLFEADASPALTADAMAPQCDNPSLGVGQCQELYRYDDRDQSLECISCNPDGATTQGVGSLYGNQFDFKLSADGDTVAFITSEGLLPSDVNRSTDIYEWRNGVIHLLTDGVTTFRRGLSAPRAIAVDGDGSNIFFALVPPDGSLTGYETDRVADLYDARIDGGFPPPSTPAHCTEDACQGPLQSAPPIENPSSAGFIGSGNPRTESKPRCRKGRVRRHGRCVKQRKRSHHKRSGHHKRGRAQ